MLKRFCLLLLVLSLAFVLIACGESPVEQEDEEVVEEFSYPEETLEFTVPFGPGGGNDVMARTIVDILQTYDFYDQPIRIENREGGSGATGWGFVHSNRGNPYHITTTSGSYINTPLVSNVGFNYESFTSIALMGTDDLLLLVNFNSEHDTLESFIAAAQEAAEAGSPLSIGGIGAVSDEMMVPRLLGEAAGFEFNYVPFQADGEVVGALLSESIDAMVGNASKSIGHIEGETMKPLGFSGLERLSLVPDVPTFTELGYEVSVPQPRGIVMAGDIPEEVKEWWVETMRKVSETDEWAKYLTDNGITEYMLFGDDFTEFLERTSNTYEEILKDLGEI